MTRLLQGIVLDVGYIARHTHRHQASANAAGSSAGMRGAEHGMSGGQAAGAGAHPGEKLFTALGTSVPAMVTRRRPALHMLCKVSGTHVHL